jgi:enterochelin esterase family protein
MMRLAWRLLLCWLPPTAGVGTLAGQTRSPVTDEIRIDTISGLQSRWLARVPPVRILLPAGYERGADRYPVLFANDGQDMETVGLVDVMDSLVSAGRMQPIIVVAVNAGADRLQNYGTAGEVNAQGLGARAREYESFLINDLWPLVERRYRTRPGNTAIMGWSLGGLSAFDIGWRNSERFQKVGVFSGSFWWRTDDTDARSKQSSRIVHRNVSRAGPLPRLRFWLQAGRQDETADRDGNGVIDSIQDTGELIDLLVAKGMRLGPDIEYLEVEGGHNLDTWRRALPHFLVWAFGAVGP